MACIAHTTVTIADAADLCKQAVQCRGLSRPDAPAARSTTFWPPIPARAVAGQGIVAGEFDDLLQITWAHGAQHDVAVLGLDFPAWPARSATVPDGEPAGGIAAVVVPVDIRYMPRVSQADCLDA